MTTERLNRITARARRVEAEAEEKANAENRNVTHLAEQIKALAPRIKELLVIGRALRNNNLPLGDLVPDIIGRRESLCTDGIHHGLGYFCDPRTKMIRGIGIEGGGCCGNDLIVDENGNITTNPINVVIGRWRRENAYWDYCRKCKTFIDGFGEFEKKVFFYVDHL